MVDNDYLINLNFVSQLSLLFRVLQSSRKL